MKHVWAINATTIEEGEYLLAHKNHIHDSYENIYTRPNIWNNTAPHISFSVTSTWSDVVKHRGTAWDVLLLLQLQTECFTLKIVAYFKSWTCLYAGAQGICFQEVTAQKVTHKVNNWRKPCSHKSLLFNSTGRIIRISSGKHWDTKPIWIWFFFFKQLTTKTFTTVSVLMQHYYFQGQYYTCSYLELHILALFLTSDRASCTVVSSTVFTNTPKLQLLLLLAYLATAKRRVLKNTQ